MARRLQIQKKSQAPTFNLFGRLPIELRDKIWFLALPGHGRIIELFFEKNPPWFCDIKVTSPTKAPDLLFVNEESALETRRHYKPLNLGPGYYFPTDILVDFSIDTIYLSTLRNPALTIYISQSPQLHRLKSLAIDATVWRQLVPSFLNTCPKLESLTICFQKSTLHDIKPASPAETLTFMSQSLYFSKDNCYTKSVFAADRGIRDKAMRDFQCANIAVAAYFIQPGEKPGKYDEHVGIFKEFRKVDETWKGLFGATRTTCEVEIEGRIIDIRFVVALYPRESAYEGLKPRFNEFRSW